MKKLAFVFSFMILGAYGFANYASFNMDESISDVKTEYLTVEDRCYVRYCVDTGNGLSCTDWKEVPCKTQ